MYNLFSSNIPKVPSLPPKEEHDLYQKISEKITPHKHVDPRLCEGNFKYNVSKIISYKFLLLVF